jgi:hypothetical protein
MGEFVIRQQNLVPSSHSGRDLFGPRKAKDRQDQLRINFFPIDDALLFALHTLLKAIPAIGSSWGK